jgi:hypothetical protein
MEQMSEIKVKPKGTIKKLEKEVIQIQKFKNNLITTKEKINEFTINENNNTAEDYASQKIQNDISYVSRKGASKVNEIGKKSLKGTQQNFIKSKQKVEVLKSKINEKKATNKIKNSIKQSIKTSQNTAILTKKGIKTSEQFAKNSEKIAKESIEFSKKVANVTRKTIQVTSRSIKVVTKATVQAIKAIVAGTKAVVSAIIAGGWIAVVIILIITIIGGFIATIFNSNGASDYDSSQIPNSEIVLVAKAQIGNEGGEKFWKWYGFQEYVQWCACYVSWCANECGYIDKGIIPKFSSCTDGINWFKEKNEWQDRGESYYPIVGDIIFFDWKDENGNQDGTSDHVGIVTRTDITNRTIYTIEGNTSNKCAERIYSFDDEQVMGYGSPKYE